MNKRIALFRLLIGIGLFTLFLINKNPYERVLNATLALFLAHITGRKIRLMPILLFTTTIIFLHLLRPSGEILFQWGPVRIGRDNLERGILRAATLSGLIGLSRFTISHHLPIPGTLGQLLNETFLFLEMFLNESLKDFARHPVQEIDRLLLKSEKGDAEGTSKKSPVSGIVVIISGTVSIAAYLSILFFFNV